MICMVFEVRNKEGLMMIDDLVKLDKERRKKKKIMC